MRLLRAAAAAPAQRRAALPARDIPRAKTPKQSAKHPLQTTGGEILSKTKRTLVLSHLGLEAVRLGKKMNELALGRAHGRKHHVGRNGRGIAKNKPSVATNQSRQTRLSPSQQRRMPLGQTKQRLRVRPVLMLPKNLSTTTQKHRHTFRNLLSKRLRKLFLSNLLRAHIVTRKHRTPGKRLLEKFRSIEKDRTKILFF